MGLQHVGGEYLHIESTRSGNTVQVWMSDDRHITHLMFDERQAVDMIRKLEECLTKEIPDA
jgi:hypothetical protein